VAIGPWVVQEALWIGDPGAEGSLYIAQGTVVDLDPADAGLVEYYGGIGNLSPLPGNQTGDDADHHDLGN
jgi:hypothetical protein